MPWNEKRLLQDSVEETITEWIPDNLGYKGKVFIYIIDHGGRTLGQHSSYIVLRNRGEIPYPNGQVGLWPVKLYPSELAGYIEKMESKCKSRGYPVTTCTVVIDACFAGNFIKPLSKIIDDEIIGCTFLQAVFTGVELVYLALLTLWLVWKFLEADRVGMPARKVILGDRRRVKRIFDGGLLR